MPKVARSPEQLVLDAKIQKCKQLLRHLLNSQKSLRLKQKAERERDRRAGKLNNLDETIAATYGALATGLDNVLQGGGNADGNNAGAQNENAEEDADEVRGCSAGEPAPKRVRPANANEA